MGIAVMILGASGSGKSATKRNLYAASRTIAVNGLSSNTTIVKITPWWKTAEVWVAIVLALITVITGVGYGVLEAGTKKEGGKKSENTKSSSES